MDELGQHGVTAVSLLVIPDHHRRGHVREDPAFCAWLQRQVAAGHEAVLHGYYHQRETRAGETWRDRLVTRAYTAGEGEFYDLPYDRAKALVARGRDDLQAVGLKPTGFIAPAWLLSDPAEQALRDLGFAYTTRLGGVWKLQNGEIERSQSLCWSVRAAWRRLSSLAWNAWLFRRLRDRPLLRLAIHPVDFAHPRIWRQITRMITAAEHHRRVMTYEQWTAV